jgi:hypothetical protein
MNILPSRALQAKLGRRAAGRLEQLRDDGATTETRAAEVMHLLARPTREMQKC